MQSKRRLGLDVSRETLLCLEGHEGGRPRIDGDARVAGLGGGKREEGVVVAGDGDVSGECLAGYLELWTN